MPEEHARLINNTLERLQPRTTIFPRSSGTSLSDGGLAVLLRGGSFRGAPSNSVVERVEAQLECARSIDKALLRPFHAAGLRAEVFVMVYDADLCSSSYNATSLWRPYSKWLRAVTTVSAAAADQLSVAACALHVFVRHCNEYAEAYDAVVITRFDMRFKTSLADLLGTQRLSNIDGVRFLWHELGNDWRSSWSPSPEMVARATARGDEKTMTAWRHHTRDLITQSSRTFRSPIAWKQDARVPDVFHLFGFRCASALHHLPLHHLPQSNARPCWRH